MFRDNLSSPSSTDEEEGLDPDHSAMDLPLSSQMEEDGHQHPRVFNKTGLEVVLLADEIHLKENSTNSKTLLSTLINYPPPTTSPTATYPPTSTTTPAHALHHHHHPHQHPTSVPSPTTTYVVENSCYANENSNSANEKSKYKEIRCARTAGR
jgi:hypothetical protein